MSERMECPGCGSYSSTVLNRFYDGEPCPSCGLSAGAMGEILAVRKTSADKALIEKYEALVKEVGQARAEATRARRFMQEIQSAMETLRDE